MKDGDSGYPITKTKDVCNPVFSQSMKVHVELQGHLLANGRITMYVLNQ